MASIDPPSSSPLQPELVPGAPEPVPPSQEGGPGPRSLRRDAARNRERLLAAAEEVFAQKGTQARLSEVAQRAGVGMGTIYRRFPDKEALIAALVDQKLAVMTAVARQAAAQPTGWEAFASLVRHMAQLISRDQALAELMLSEYGQRYSRAGATEYRSLVGAIIKRAQAEGSLRPDVAPTDVPPLLNMAAAAADYTADLGREVWPRYLQFMLEGLKQGSHNQALPAEALTDAEQALARRSSWRRRAALGRATQEPSEHAQAN